MMRLRRRWAELREGLRPVSNNNLSCWVKLIAARNVGADLRRLAPVRSLSRLRGRVGAGVPPQTPAQVERIPPPATLFERHSRSFASVSTAAEGGLCSPASRRGKGCRSPKERSETERELGRVLITCTHKMRRRADQGALDVCYVLNSGAKADVAGGPSWV